MGGREGAMLDASCVGILRWQRKDHVKFKGGVQLKLKDVRAHPSPEPLRSTSVAATPVWMAARLRGTIVAGCGCGGVGIGCCLAEVVGG